LRIYPFGFLFFGSFNCGVVSFSMGGRLEASAIPAKAGTQSVDIAYPKPCGVDSGFRGSDCDWDVHVLQMTPAQRASFSFPIFAASR
jgi:hypothetical protein